MAGMAEQMVQYMFPDPGRRHPRDADLLRGAAVGPSDLERDRSPARLAVRDGPAQRCLARATVQDRALAARADPHLYELLALLDALRDGRARERTLAEREIVKHVREHPPA